MKDWEIYEEQIFEKLRKEFPNSNILKNQKIIGKYSKRSRQIDILVKSKIIGKELIVIVDCKKFKKKIDVKAVESFIGFTEDVGAHVGIMITNEGFTNSAYNRVENIHRDIKLDIVEFISLENYHFYWDTCEGCSNSEQSRISEISWSEPHLLAWKDLFQLIKLGQCDYCGTLHMKCQGCGSVIEIEDLNYTICGCGLTFGVEGTKPGDELSISDIVIIDAEKDLDKKFFFDPDQVNL